MRKTPAKLTLRTETIRQISLDTRVVGGADTGKIDCTSAIAGIPPTTACPPLR